MKLGTFYQQITSSVKVGQVESMDKAFATLKDLGLSYVDIDSGVAQPETPVKELYKLLKGYDIHTGSVFCWHRFPHQSENFMAEMKEYTKKQLDFIAELDCKIYMPVPFVGGVHETPEARKECQKKIIEYLNDIVEQSKAYGIQTVLENYSATSCPFAYVQDIADILSQVPDLHYVLDCGNFWFSNSDVLEAARKFAHLTDHVHLKDLIPHPDGVIKVEGNNANSVAIGAGIIPFEEIFSILKGVNYEGGLTVEINSSKNAYAEMIESLKYINQAW